MHLSATAVDNVRGVLATAHVFVKPGTAETRPLEGVSRGLRQRAVRAHREGDAPASTAIPEPKILSGSNYADVGFELDPTTGRVVALCAIDNLMKGAAGTALQCANIMMGWDETLGLEFPGLHPDLTDRDRDGSRRSEGLSWEPRARSLLVLPVVFLL